MSTLNDIDDATANANLAWCTGFLAEAKRLGEYEDGGELWEFMGSIAADAELRPLDPAEAARKFFRTNG